MSNRAEELDIRHEEYSYAVGWLSNGHVNALDRIERMIACPGNKQALLASLSALRDSMAGTLDGLQKNLIKNRSGEGA